MTPPVQRAEPEAPPSLKRQAVRGTLWYGGSRIVVQATTWIITLVVVRLLTPADYGLFGFATLISDLTELIAELGLGAAIIQKRDITDDELETVFWLSLASAAAVYAAVWAGAPFIAGFFNQPLLTSVLRVSMVAFVLGSARVVSWNLLTKQVDFKRRSVAEGAATVAGAATTLAFAYAGWGVWALVFGQLLRQALLTVACYWIVPWRPRGRFRLDAVRRVFGFGAKTSGGRIAWYFSSNADFLIVGKMIGQEALGLYSLIFQLATLPADRITSVIKQVSFPVYAKLQDQPDSFRRFFLKTITLVSLVTFPLMTGLLSVADVAVPALLTAKWQPMTRPLQIMCGMGMVLSISALVAPAVLAKGHPGLILRFHLLCLAVLPAGFFVGAAYGLEGVCWAWVILFPIVAAVWFRMTRPLIGYAWRELLSALWPALVCTASMAAVVAGTRLLSGSVQVPLVRLVLLIAAGVIGYGAVLMLGFRRQIRELRDSVFARA